ncbi:MAG: 2-dehydropantoate 2-reductase N-terminal domain-containing protein, partial [Candidatus Baltobacteraceae bacterium]
MKVYIVGRGAVGTYLGDRLQSIGIEVAYAPRDLAAVTPFEADVAIVATKAYDTESAVETLRAAIAYPQKCVFVTPQNGVGNEEILAAAFGADNVVAAALTVPVDRDRSGNVKPTHDGGLAFAPVGSSAFNWLTATFASSGINVKVVEDYHALKWSKLALNVVANASCAILNVLPHRLVHFEKIFTLEIRMIREVRAVMQVMNVTPMDLPRYPVKALFGVASLPSPIARSVMSTRV